MKDAALRTNSFVQYISRHKFIYSAIITTLLIAIIATLAVIFGVQKHSTAMSAVIVPLYVYPSPGAWDPLHEAIISNAGLTFIVVVNPQNGPGATASPDANYTREIPRLNSHANVHTLGYVATGYTTRDLEAVKRDIQTYSAWQWNATISDLGMHGIFFDETPSEYDLISAQYLSEAQAEARAAKGFESSCLLINNPGTIPDVRYLDGPNITVVFEGTYETYQRYRFGHNITELVNSAQRTTSSSTSRSELACIIHGVPEGVVKSDSGMMGVVNDLRSAAGTVYVTDLSENYYASFGSSWKRFVELMAFQL